MSTSRRTFLKLSSALLATPLISPLFAWAKGTKMAEDKMAVDKLKNWAGNLEYSTESLYSANSFEQARDFVKKQSQLKVLGTRHCFNNIADSKYNLLSLRSMDKVIALDPAARTVTVEAGTVLGRGRAREREAHVQARHFRDRIEPAVTASALIKDVRRVP